MASDQVAQVRRFSRLVTQRIGALDDHYLARDRPLGEARLLWEIGPDGCDVRTLRSRLGLDSGYVSRLLRSLESAGLITVEPGAYDKRVRTARLTPSGATERAVLDERSDDLAETLLDPLDQPKQAQLVAAMTTVCRLLTAGAVTYEVADPSTPAGQHCLREYFAELDRRFDVGFDPARSNAPDAGVFAAPSGALLVASLWSEPLGCGGIIWQEDGIAYIKRMWIDPSARGLGIGRRLLTELEALALRHGCKTVRLETNRALTEAVALYRSAGYAEVEPFSDDEPYADHWFTKRLESDDSA